MKKTLLLILGLICIGLVIILATRGPKESVVTNDAPRGKVAANTSVSDGEQYAQVSSVNQNPEDMTVTYTHVVYFTGDEAKLSAEAEVECAGAIESCVPSLNAGYYVRASGAPLETVPVTASTKIQLKSNAKASKDEFATYVETSAVAPVFVLTVKDGNITHIKEI